MQYQVHVFRLDGACIGILPALHGTRFVAGEPKRVRARNCNIYYAYILLRRLHSRDTIHTHTLQHYYIDKREQWTGSAVNCTIALQPDVMPTHTYTYVLLSRALTSNRFPDLWKTHPYTTTLMPGDILYNPHKWWHEVYTMGQSVAYVDQRP